MKLANLSDDWVVETSFVYIIHGSIFQFTVSEAATGKAL